MPINTPRDLFLYELGVIRDAEYTGQRLLDFLAHRATQSDLVQILQIQQQDGEQLANINACLRALGVSPVEIRAETVDGMYKRFEEFISLRPSPDMLDQFAVDTAMRFLYYGIAAYKNLVDWAILMGETRCVQCLYTNLVRKQDGASRLERFSHEFGARILAPA